jgi:LemA protein
MNKFVLGCGGLVVILVVIAAVFFAGKYNQLVGLQQKVDAQWAQVQNVYQRRADLIPNLVNTVSGAANFEKSTLEAVTNARASVGRVQLDPNKAPSDAAQLEQFQAAQGQLSAALQDYNVAVRSFPTVLIAGMLGFPPKPFFTAQPGAEKPPPVQFNFSSPAPAAPAATP